MALTNSEFKQIGDIIRKTLETQFAGFSERFSKMETTVLTAIQRLVNRIEHLPTREEVDELRERIQRLEEIQKHTAQKLIH